MKKYTAIDVNFPAFEQEIEADEILLKTNPGGTVTEFITYNNGETLCEGATVVAILPYTFAVIEKK